MKLSHLPISQIITFVVGKVVGLMFASIVFSIPFQFAGLIDIFKPVSVIADQSQILLSSYSDLFLFTIMSSGLLLSLFMNVDRQLNITRDDINKYLDHKSDKFFSTIYKMYGQSVLWLLFLWVTNVYILYNALTGKTYLWIYLVVMILSISITIYFYFDFDKEIDLAKQKLLKREL